MTPQQSDWFHNVVSGLAYSLASPLAQSSELAPPYNDLTQFILAQRAQMPDYLRTPMKAVALGFDCAGVLRHGKRFHCQTPEHRANQLNAWKHSKLSFQRDFVRYFESMAAFGLCGRAEPASPVLHENGNSDADQESPTPEELRAEVVVIGSGPGGAITACLLAEAGCDVLLVEEGSYLPQSSCAPFSKTELLQKYRNGGQTLAFGRNKIAYVEGRCVGGGSEINSGLYHRTPPEVLERWRKEFQVEALNEADLLPHFEQSERDVSVSPLPHPPPPASLKLHEGATGLGWKSLAAPRWFRYDTNRAAQRQSMTETFIPRFLKAGGRLQAQTCVLRFRQNGSGWLIESTQGSGNSVWISADYLFLCAGAVHTPTLLRRSGITRNVGNSLQVHPTVKIVARFREPVNAADMGVPVHKVDEFWPRLTFGCSVSTPAYLALGLLDHPEAEREVFGFWPNAAIYYAMILSDVRGTVRTLPGFRDPLVRYNLNNCDRQNLADGLRKLGQLLFASGATTLYPGLTQGTALRSEGDLKQLPEILPKGRANLMTIHLFSSCPMGEERAKCATDSFGRLHGFKNLFVNDASLLCTAPGVNPQGSIMAIARRNALKFLSDVRKTR